MVLARCVFAEDREIVQVEIDVVRNEQIDEAVVVVVAEGQSRSPALVAVETGFLRHVRKRPVVVVVVEHDSAEAAYGEVGPAIVVEVANGHAHRPAGIADACLVGDVRKGAIVIVVIERAARSRPGLVHRDAGRVGEVQVRISVVVVVDDRDSAAHGLDDIARFRTREMIEVNTGGSRDIDQTSGLGRFGARIFLILRRR